MTLIVSRIGFGDLFGAVAVDTFIVEHDVLRLEVPVDDSLLMQVAECH